MYPSAETMNKSCQAPHDSRDKAMTMPRRRPSDSSQSSVLHMLQHQLLSSSSENQSTYPLQFLPELSFNDFDSCIVSTSSGSLLCEHWLQSSSDFTVAIIETAEKEDERRVRFAPLPTTDIIIVMGISDFTAQEVEDCWYSRGDLEHMGGQREKEVIRCPKKEGGDRRWVA